MFHLRILPAFAGLRGNTLFTPCHSIHSSILYLQIFTFSSLFLSFFLSKTNPNYEQFLNFYWGSFDPSYFLICYSTICFLLWLAFLFVDSPLIMHCYFDLSLLSFYITISFLTNVGLCEHAFEFSSFSKKFHLIVFFSMDFLI